MLKTPEHSFDGFSRDSVRTAIALAEELFSGPVSAEQSYDPENAERRWLVVNAFGEGDSREIRRRRLEWHDRLREQIGAQAGSFALCVVPVS